MTNFDDDIRRISVLVNDLGDGRDGDAWDRCRVVLEAAGKAREAKDKYVMAGFSEWGNYMTAIGALTEAALRGSSNVGIGSQSADGPGSSPGPRSPAPSAEEPIQIVFDGPPAHESGRFVEVEQGGCSINFGEWKHRVDGYWVLELPAAALPVKGKEK